MPKSGRPQQLFVSELLNHGAAGWPKKAKAWEKAIAGNEVVYEDAYVVAYHDAEDAPHESPREPGEMRITILVKERVPTLMDLNVAHEALNAHVLLAVQQVAYTLGLQNCGFEVRAHVLPPYQHRPGLAFRIYAGHRPTGNG